MSGVILTSIGSVPAPTAQLHREDYRIVKLAWITVLVLALLGPAVPALAQQGRVLVPENSHGAGAGRAITTSNLNVRGGPATRYPILDVLLRGDMVRINVCDDGWCWINHDGPSGWVSEAHLERIGAPGFIVRPLREACFFDAPNFRGRSFCLEADKSMLTLGAWNNSIASVRVRGRAFVQLCSERELRGCTTIDADTASVPRRLQRNISSVRVLQ